MAIKNVGKKTMSLVTNSWPRAADIFRRVLFCSYNQSFLEFNLKNKTFYSLINFDTIFKMKNKKEDVLLRTPVQTVNNYFDHLSRLLGCSVLKPKYNKYNESGYDFWVCEYKIFWPETKVFWALDLTKKKAKEGSAHQIVNFLKEKNVINQNGTPLFYNQDVTPFMKILTRNHSTTNGKSGINVKIPQTIEETPKNTKIQKLFPHPRHTLGNTYAVVAKEKDSKEYLLSPSYMKNSLGWTCTFKIKWPEIKTFQATNKTKKEAADVCANEILSYLMLSKKINDKGSPLVHDTTFIKDVLKKDVPVLHFNEEQINKLSSLVDFHSREIFPLIMDTIVPEKLYEEIIENKVRFDEFQKYLGFNSYKCVENLMLPVSEYKEEIKRLVRENRVVIVKGEPGCGKSTRIPQYILEDWAEKDGSKGEPCRIVVTEPRRIAAVSLADRVAAERKQDVGSIVGYQVRFKSNFQHKTGRILYCTNGVLLQQLKSDPTLSKYSHVIIDEAHERDINTDLLLNMLRTVVLDKNPKLKVLIMSATIDTDLFQNYFKGSALIHIPGFTHPVKSFYLDKCKLNLDKTLKMNNEAKPSVIHEEVVKVLLHLHKSKPEGAILCFLPGWEDIKKIRDMMPRSSSLNVLCLHSRLDDTEQWRIFGRSPAGVRKIILSTNIAETSVTIDDVVYVVDTGIHKETRLDVEKGVMCIDNHWISRSSVDQRRGRAGRVRPGECFHLYTRSKMENDFSKFSLPEVLRVSLTKVVLDSKLYDESATSASEFFDKLPSPPGDENVALAVEELKDLELLDEREKLTPLGKILVEFQLEPKMAKTLINSVVYRCVSPIVDIVTIFSSGMEIFASGLERKEDIRSLKASFSKTSDHLALMRIFEIWQEFAENGLRNKQDEFCDDLYLIGHKLQFMKALRDIHFDYLTENLRCKAFPIVDEFSDDDELVKGVLLSGVGSFLRKKNWTMVNGRLKKENLLLNRSDHKATLTQESVNFKWNNTMESNFLLYMNETRSNLRKTTLIRESSLVSPLLLLLFSNKKLAMHNISKDRSSKNLASEDQVHLNLVGTNLNFVLDRQQALILMQCKLALTSCYDHFVYELTEGGQHDKVLGGKWEQLLSQLVEVLNHFKNE